jgi:D-glycero-D-manno-heptose 1,7-bisphosphate phosphatase
MKIEHIILDRDGTLIKYIPYLFEKEKVELINGTTSAIKLLIEKNIKIYLHTNQSGVGRGYFEIINVQDCNNRMIELIGLGESIFQDICIAPDFPPSKVSYRKPSSLFANELIEKYNLDKSSLAYIGDSISDLKTAKNIECNAYGVMSGGYDLETLIKSETDLNYNIFPNLLEVVNYLIKNKKI